MPHELVCLLLAVGSAGAVDEESALQSVHVHSAGGRQYELMSKQKRPLDGELYI